MHDLTTRPISMDLPRTALIPTYLGEPMLPAPVARTRYVRRTWRTRAARFIRANGVVIGLCAPAPVAAAYAITQILGGAR